MSNSPDNRSWVEKHINKIALGLGLFALGLAAINKAQESPYSPDNSLIYGIFGIALIGISVWNKVSEWQNNRKSRRSDSTHLI